MAGDWIKMRVDLATSPKVVRIASALRADRLRVIGGLHAVWCLFDVHSTDGHLDGYTLDALDELIGFPGFGAAMVAVGWLEDGGDYLCTPRFDEHNGQSAKRRAMETERKREARKLSASDADKLRSREEKRRDTSSLRSEVEPPRKRSAPPQLARPADVAEQTWADWLALRKAKKAPVTETVIQQAMAEADKAGMPLDAFLQVWCMRGSQGLQADWLKPAERQVASRQPMSYAQQDELARRARWEEMTGRKWPEAVQPVEAGDFIDVDMQRIA
ncbi:hypothetical protein [Quisquiliibacterium transsilvanicum]|uniref:Uncharacterized protein n=1 Tax=Quisquiliibacterium transsilvanicum TaxID=1549638 RepID=A0A7W8M8Z2_9BURK|nr:hypothetical protein [Quisquiliibacterium transsilvanicum]MBB5271529.1 hypothetical protein [Quisquiliibacterium transsilvanicum]